MSVDVQQFIGTAQYIATDSLKLAVKAAWIIECKQNRRATDKEVMSLLQEWADKGSEPAVLKKSQMNNRCVIWTTDKCKEKTYTLEACQKALRTWNKSRQ